MNSTMIENREYVENLHNINSNVNLRLLASATKFFKQELDVKTRKELFSLPLVDKMWLLNEYTQEIKTNTPPDLSSLY